MLSRYDIDTYKSTAFSSTFFVKDTSGNAVNLSGYSVTGSIYDRAGQNVKYADFNTYISSYVSGSVSYSLSHDVLSGIPVTQGTYLIKLQSSGDSYIRGLHGYINFNPL